MKNSDSDINTRFILHQSKLEMPDPDFNSILMEKIRSERRKSVQLHKRITYLVYFLGMDATIYIFLKLFDIDIFSSHAGNGSVYNEIFTKLISLKNLLFENHIIIYSLVAVMLFTLVHIIASADYKYSS